jgi:hypothetical protein
MVSALQDQSTARETTECHGKVVRCGEQRGEYRAAASLTHIGGAAPFRESADPEHRRSKHGGAGHRAGVRRNREVEVDRRESGRIVDDHGDRRVEMHGVLRARHGGVMDDAASVSPARPPVAAAACSRQHQQRRHSAPQRMIVLIDQPIPESVPQGPARK